MTTVRLPENVVKVLSSSKVEAGLFSKKPLNDKEINKILTKYEDDLEKLYNSYLKKIGGNKELLSNVTVNYLKEIERKNEDNEGKKKGLIQNWKEKGKLKEKVYDEGEKILKKYKNKIEVELADLINNDVFNLSSRLKGKYEKTPETESLRKDLENLKNKYGNLLSLKDIGKSLAELILDGEYLKDV